MSAAVVRFGDAWRIIEDMTSDSVDHVITDHEYGAPFFLDELTRICPSGNIATFCDPYRRPFDLRYGVAKNGKRIPIDDRYVWSKPPSTKNTSCHPSLFDEEILVRRGTDGHSTYNSDVLYWACASGRFEDTHILKPVHEWEKPLSLAEKLVLLLTKKGDTIFDPFCGSGRIGEACLKHGRNFIGIDNQQKWIDLAKERLGL